MPVDPSHSPVRLRSEFKLAPQARGQAIKTGPEACMKGRGGVRRFVLRKYQHIEWSWHFSGKSDDCNRDPCAGGKREKLAHVTADFLNAHGKFCGCKHFRSLVFLCSQRVLRGFLTTGSQSSRIIPAPPAAELFSIRGKTATPRGHENRLVSLDKEAARAGRLSTIRPQLFFFFRPFFFRPLPTGLVHLAFHIFSIFLCSSPPRSASSRMLFFLPFTRS